VACLFALLFLHISPSKASNAVLSAPQRLEYRVAWNHLRAAMACVAVHHGRLEGEDAYFVEASAWTNRVVDVFWKFRGKAQTTVSAGDLRPLRFSFDRTANRRVESTWVEFDDAKNRARGVYVKNGKRKEREVELLDLADPLTAALRALTRPLAAGDEFATKVFTGESLYVIDFKVLAEEDVTVPAGRFAAYKVEPTVWKVTDEQRRDKRVRKTTLWVSRETPRAVLRVRSEVFIGALTIELLSWSKPLPPAAASP